jgi:hypothetical protein
MQYPCFRPFSRLEKGLGDEVNKDFRKFHHLMVIWLVSDSLACCAVAQLPLAMGLA